MKPVVLVVDDEPLQRGILQTILDGEGYETITAGSGSEALAAIRKVPPDVVVSDLKMAGMDGIELLNALPQEPAPPPVIIVTAHGTIDSAVEAVKLGAFDYLTKPLDKQKILMAVRKACERSEILKENVRLKKELFERFRMEGIIARSPRMRETVELLKKVADSPATVMVLGESGTGKELVARAIHYNSPRRGKPFTAINCAAIPESLFESELFGHEPGAFTGAVSRRAGLFEISNGGTLFLDEIGELPLPMQSKLLRVLQDREVRRVGGKETFHVDVRIISATNKDLEHEMEKGTFREDLFYRLSVVNIELPPLRERSEDIPALVEHFVQKFNAEFHRGIRQVDDEAMAALRSHPWPGNVRQLSSVIERAVLLSDCAVLTGSAINRQLHARKGTTRSPYDFPEEGLDFEQLERDLIQKALNRTGGVATKAAKLLHMNYKAFLYRMEKFGLRETPDNGEEPKTP
jgi:DNA-binding NtrC family response regulator